MTGQHAQFQAAVHYTSTHLEQLAPVHLRFLALFSYDGGYYLAPTKPLVRPMEFTPLFSYEQGDAPNGWKKPTDPWDVLLDAAGGGPCLTHLDEGELYGAALKVCRSEYADDLYSAQTLLKQLHVLLAAKLGIRISSFAELPGIDETARAEVIGDLARANALIPNGMEDFYAGHTPASDTTNDEATDLDAFRDLNPKRRRSRR